MDWRASLMATLFGLGGGSCLASQGADEGDFLALLQSEVEIGCNTFEVCNCDAFGSTPYSSVEACIESETEYAQLIHRVGEEAGLTPDLECFARIIARREALGCNTEWGPEPFFTCKLQHGSRALGESCSVVDLAEGDDCLPELRCYDGVCAAHEPVFTGEPCAWRFPYCADASFCEDLSTGSWQCTANPEQGEPCIAGVLCLGGTCTEAGVCDFPPKLNEACDAESGCDKGLVCGVGSARCEVPPVVAAGESCSAATCEPGLECSPTSSVCTVAAPLYCEHTSGMPRPPSWPAPANVVW